MLKIIGKGSWFLAAALLITLGVGPEALAANAKAENFAQKDQTLEYHFMLSDGSLTEKEMGKILAEKILTSLKPIADVEPLSKPNKRFYVDSRDRVLEKNKLIIRVRDGKITVKARATAPEVLLDLEKCHEKSYEMDFFDEPEYSISSDLKFTKEEFDASPSKWTIPDLLRFMEKQCPALTEQLRPVVKDGTGIEIPGAANIYGTDVALKHPLAKKVRNAGLAVWFFPPTNKALVELAFTGYVRDKAALDKLYGDFGKFLKEAGLLKAEQVSKTEQYFQAYFGR
jgi:hypothetical protein